jgi:hypothetical protein
VLQSPEISADGHEGTRQAIDNALDKLRQGSEIFALVGPKPLLGMVTVAQDVYQMTWRRIQRLCTNSGEDNAVVGVC